MAIDILKDNIKSAETDLRTYNSEIIRIEEHLDDLIRGRNRLKDNIAELQKAIKLLEAHENQ